MNQNEYLKELKRCLSSLDRAETDRIVEYYSELISDKIQFGVSEQEVITQLGTPHQLADRIIAESKEYEDKANDNKSERKYVKKFYTISESEASSISVYTDMMKVKVCVREDNSDEIRITYFENNKHKPSITNENGIVTLNDKTEFSASNIFSFLIGFEGIKRGRLETVIELPKNNNTLKISIETNNAKITANNLTVDKLFLKTSNASIDVSGNFVSEVYCKTSNSKINSENLSADSITFITSNGMCNADTVISKSLSIKTSNSSISIKNINSDIVSLKTSNSSINLGDTIAKTSFYAKTSNGSINTKGIVSDKIELSSCNGGISSTIVGRDKDFAIQSKTSNSNNNLLGRGDSSTSKTLSVYTSNGKIDISFDDEYSIPEISQHSF